MSTTKLERCLRLFMSFQTQGTLATRDAARILDVPSHQARRDIRALQDAGVPIEAVGSGRNTQYRLSGDYRRSGIRVTQGDAFALHFGRQLLGFAEGTALTGWLEDLRDKLEGLLPASAEANEARLAERLVFLSEPYRPYGAKDDALNEVLTALLLERELQVTYQPRQGEPRQWTDLQPLALVIYRRGLYLLARFPSSRGVLRLAVDRIEWASRGAPFRYPKDFDPHQELSRSFGIFDDGRAPSLVRLRFVPRVADLVRERIWHPTARLTASPDGAVVLSMRATGQELVRLALEWGAAVQVLEPDWLRDQVIDELRQAVAQYG